MCIRDRMIGEQVGRIGIDNEQARTVARLSGPQGDAFIGQIEIEKVYAHWGTFKAKPALAQ